MKINRRRYGRAVVATMTAVSVAATTRADDPQDQPSANQPVANQPSANQPGPRESPFERDYAKPSFEPSWSKPQINRTLVADFVIYAHSDLEMTTTLLDREPGLINASMDWGDGDFETALGGASHMGRRDIVSFLLSRGARPNLFCAAMLGQLAVVQTMLDFEPRLIDATGPHGFSLHFHAQVGGESAKEVLDYLQRLAPVELRPVPFLKSK